MRRCLYEHFGKYGIGEEQPSPRPLIGSDLIASGYLASWLMGCDVSFTDDDAPQVLCANLSDEDVMALSVPVLEERPIWQNVASQMNELEARFGHVHTCINLMGVILVALDLRGQQLFIDFSENPDIADHLLTVCAGTIAQIGREFRLYSDELSSGVTSVMSKVAPKVYLTSNCSVDMISLNDYERFLLRHDIMLAQTFAPFGMHHCGKSMERVIHGYTKIPGLSFVEVGAGSDIDKIMGAISDDVVVNLRISPVALRFDDREKIEKQILHMQAMVPEHRLSISCVGVDDKVSDERVGWFFEIAGRT